MRIFHFFLFATICLITAYAQPVPPVYHAGVFQQEVSRAYTKADGLLSNNVLSIAISNSGKVYAGTDKGLSTFDGASWKTIDGVDGPVTLIVITNDAVIALTGATWMRIEPKIEPAGWNAVDGVNDAALANTPWFAMNNGINRIVSEAIQQAPVSPGAPYPGEAYCIKAGPFGAIAAGTENGLYLSSNGAAFKPVYPNDESGRSWAPREVKALTFDEQSRMWFGSPQGVGMFDGKSWTLFEGKDGLPINRFTCAAAGGGAVWFGGPVGAIRYDGDGFAYRQGPRWLPGDDVRGVTVNEKGEAWFATAKGVGFIGFQDMTLAQKAAFYEDEADKFIKRTEFGYLSEVNLEKPGDKSHIIYSDSDNDGLWTSMYGAGECFAYAATKDPKAKERATKAFEALRYLSIAPANGEIEQQPGFVARTVLPTTEPDPNLRHGHTLEGQREDRDNGDTLWKVYTPRWVKTRDGKYWYKTDTSSDELDGHYFFYAQYYELAAETDAEKDAVREVVRNLTDHLMRNDYCLIDHDGTPTRWAVYSPDALNHDPNWWSERGLKSLSILSYLTVAEHITGDAKYSDAIRELREKDAFDTNAMIAKVQFGIGSGNQSDDEMAVMNYYDLIRYTKDETLRSEMAYSFYQYWIMDQPEMNPFFNYAFAACSYGIQYSNPWGSYWLQPWEGWLDDSMATLHGFPLDRANWPLHNSDRLDIVLLPRQAQAEPYEEPRRSRGVRVNGKVLPIQERHFNHWNTDPYALNYGGDGRTLASGAVYLLPYYMGLYHGFIQE
ncbi:MAG: hypothetical protein GC154_06840 [bacterium]|nr:hypothetical protein [bacterium]